MEERGEGASRTLPGPPRVPGKAEPKLRRCSTEKALLLHSLAEAREWAGEGRAGEGRVPCAGRTCSGGPFQWGPRGMQLRQTLGRPLMVTLCRCVKQGGDKPPGE